LCCKISNVRPHEAAEPATSPFAVVLLFGGPYMYWGLFFGFYFFKLYYV